MNAAVKEIEILAEEVGETGKFSDAEQARIHSAAHRIVNQTKPH